MTARTLFWKKVYVLSDLILGMECRGQDGHTDPLAFYLWVLEDRLLRKESCDGGLELFLLLVPSFTLRV